MFNMTDRDAVTGWEAIQPHITHMTYMRWICPEYNDACNEVEQAWAIYDEAVAELYDAGTEFDLPTKMMMLKRNACLLDAAVAAEDRKAAAYLKANEIYAAKHMADDLRAECAA